MSDSVVSLTLGLVGLVGGLVTAFSAVQSSKETARGAIFDAGAARNAEFQNARRKRYEELLDVLVEEDLGVELSKRIRRAQLIAREGDLRCTLDTLAADPDEFRGSTKQLSDLARAMNEDAGK
ncbi:hypothetical protein ACFTZI_36525 [Streptomyces decoyicus]|uniref:hypothetical protein n=1 Tax=Streptomyces decoyicus TaxID=249567 RepID=UPI003638DE96